MADTTNTDKIAHAVLRTLIREEVWKLRDRVMEASDEERGASLEDTNQFLHDLLVGVADEVFRSK